MAEAHSAVAFSFSVTQEGFNVHISQDALKAVYFSCVRSWRKRRTRFVNHFHSGVYPAKFSSLGLLFGVVSIFLFWDVDVTFGLSTAVHDLLFHSPSFYTWSVSYFLSSTIIWIAGVLFIRYLLRLLLQYHGFMFEPHGKISLTTKVWAICTKILGGTDPKLYSYQASLPRLPVPKLKDTVRRYLASVRPLLDDAEYEKMEKLSTDFLSTIATRLQRYLVLKSWLANNYVTDWWEKYVYLAGRAPLMVNSNYYGMDLLLSRPTQLQASRTANVMYAIFSFRSKLDKENVKPIRAMGVVPLCSAQYERLFNTCRIPGVERDSIQHCMDSRHVAVYHQGKWFKLICYKNGLLLEPKELEYAIESILKDTSSPAPGEEHLAALTAGERTPWALAREEFFSRGVNKKSLHAIEKAAFVVVLDDEEHITSDEQSTGITSFGKSLLHGKCHNRWFDKSFNLVVYKNGRFGINAEHSWADAPIISYLAEEILSVEHIDLSYETDGTVSGKMKVRPIPPERLPWSIPEKCREVVETSLSLARNLADDLHLTVMPFKHFGKGLVKTFKISPDAFIQAALQLAHLKDKGHFSLTYEASMTRLFKHGRTETVRSCSNEMTAFARSMEDSDANDEERHALLMKAVEHHVTQYKEAMVGQGIDRHLFCLYVVSKFLKVESPFLQKVLNEVWSLSTSQTAMDQGRKFDMKIHQAMAPSGGGFGPVLTEPWRLSTSQTPHQQAMRVDLKEHTEFLSGGGGFGPVADDGYGVSYIICHEDLIMFHISSKYSSPETDSDRFAKNIEESMLDIKRICERAKKSQGGKKQANGSHAQLNKPQRYLNEAQASLPLKQSKEAPSHETGPQFNGSLNRDNEAPVSGPQEQLIEDNFPSNESQEELNAPEVTQPNGSLTKVSEEQSSLNDFQEHPATSDSHLNEEPPQPLGEEN